MPNDSIRGRRIYHNAATIHHGDHGARSVECPAKPASSRRRIVKLRFGLLLLLVPVLLPAQQAGRTHLKSKLAQERNLPFSSGVLVGDTLYIAGTTGVDSTTGKPVSAEEEAKLVMDAVRDTVVKAGMTMDDIVSMQVFCTDLANYDTFNGVYKTYFKGDYPARAFVSVPKLLFGARYEVMGIAIRSHK
jgi:2-iminobutanoate/2-iminopropanoate deaminase